MITAGTVVVAAADRRKEAVAARDSKKASSVGSPSLNNNSAHSVELASLIGAISLPIKLLPTS